MRSGNDSTTAGLLVLSFLSAHFVLLAGILIRILATSWRESSKNFSPSQDPVHLPVPSTIKHEEATHETSRMQLL